MFSLKQVRIELMPHLILEYTKNLDAEIKSKQLLEKTHWVMLDSGLFNPEAVKSRTRCLEEHLLGTKKEGTSFIHIAVALLEGRTLEQKKELSKAISACIKSEFANLGSVSVEIRDMDKASYSK